MGSTNRVRDVSRRHRTGEGNERTGVRTYETRLERGVFNRTRQGYTTTITTDDDEEEVDPIGGIKDEAVSKRRWSCR